MENFKKKLSVRGRELRYQITISDKTLNSKITYLLCKNYELKRFSIKCFYAIEPSGSNQYFTKFFLINKSLVCWKKLKLVLLL